LHLSASQTHVDNNTVRARSGLGIRNSSLNTADDVRPVTRSLSIKNLDTIKLSVLSDTVGGRANGTRDVGSVAMVIFINSSIALDKSSSTAEFRVVYGNTGVNDIGAGTSASRIIVDIVS
jgi:hypothetical protein